jgi:hypothetical protein
MTNDAKRRALHLWPCPICSRQVEALYGLKNRERCLQCWVKDPGYDRPANDPFMVRLAKGHTNP